MPNSERVENLVSVLVSVADILTHNLLLHWQLRMEPVVGFEPTTDGLQNRCSTTELNWRRRQSFYAARGVLASSHPHGARIASVIPWMIFLSGGQMVARTPPSGGRAASPSPLTK